MAGWIKVYRELIKKPIWKQSKPEHACVLMTLLMMVNHQEEEWEWQGKKFIAKPGQKVTSLEKIQENCPKGIEPGQIRRALERFEKLGFLTNESTKTGRLITIENWEIYQCVEEKTTKKPTDDRQRTDKEPTPNKNDKNERTNPLYPLFVKIWCDEFKVPSLNLSAKKELELQAEKYTAEQFRLAVHEAKKSSTGLAGKISSPKYLRPILEDIKAGRRERPIDVFQSLDDWANEE